MDGDTGQRLKRTCGLRRACLLLACGLLAAGGLPAVPADVVRVPLVALDSRGAALKDISRDSLEVLANGRRAEAFALEKRAPGASPAEQRIVFLIYDTLSTSHLWLSKAKTITEKLLDSSDPGIAYLLLSLEPGAGLRYVLGPSQDRAEVVRTLRQKIVARQGGTTLDSNPHRVARDDGLLVEDPRTVQPRFGATLTEQDPISAPKTRQDERKKGELFLSSLDTLNTALSGFHDSIKTVYFFSGGIATRTQYQDRSTTNPNFIGEVQTVDTVFLNSLAGLADIFRTKGAIVFVVNPAGAQIGKNEPGSGEGQLQLLAERAGGRYLEGEPETIVQSMNEMESSFYEILLPLGEFGTDPIDIEIRSKDPGVTLHYSHRVFPFRGFASLSEDDKMRLALDAAEGGDASKMVLRLRKAEVLGKSEAGGSVQYRLRLPEGFLDSPLDVFRIWLGQGSQPTVIELEKLRSEGGELALAVEKKKGLRIRVVIIEHRSAAGLIVS
jgi:hypothetical protein